MNRIINDCFFFFKNPPHILKLGDRMIKILWGITSILMVLSGIYFTKVIKEIQFRPCKMIQRIRQAGKQKQGISSYNALMMTLAGRIGVGSLAGVALSIYLGGPGSIFWMVIMTFISAANAYAETIIAMKYREKEGPYLYVGGPPYYIKHGLKRPLLGKIVACLIIVVYVFGFLSIQANTITKSMMSLVNINPLLIGILIGGLTLGIILKGIKSISKTTGKMVPIIGGLYLLFSFFIIIKHITYVPEIIQMIIREAFHVKPFLSGFLVAMIVGIQRSIFSNEAGIGTGAIAASTASTDDAVSQGYMQIIGVYITTLVISVATAFVILLSDYQTLMLSDVNGIELTQYAFVKFLGNPGTIVVMLSIILFAFSTIIAGYYYGESSLKLLTNKKQYIWILKIVTITMLVLSSVISPTTIWNMVDILIAVLGIINILVLLKLKTVVVAETRKPTRQQTNRLSHDKMKQPSSNSD